jgi:MFS transporter, CP family, cyanate transporter
VAKRPGSHAAGLLAALFLAALALRPQLIGTAPLLPEIEEDLGVSHAVTGLLGTIPVLCMGVFAFPAGYAAARAGTRAAMGGCLLAIAVFGLLRAAAPGAPLVLALTVPIGVGIGLAGALMPVAVKERFPDRPAFASGVYVTGINLGATLASALAVPIAGALGGWRAALAVLSAASLLCFLGWVLLTRRPADSRRSVPSAERVAFPWRRGLVWALVGVFGLQALIYYGLNSWLPAALQEQGWSGDAAGALLAAMGLFALPFNLAVPFMADRFGSRRQWLALSTVALIAGTLGLATLPGAAWGWVAMVGFGLGSIFPLVLTLPLDVAREPGEAGSVVALVLGGGYSIGALAPLALGAIRDATGSYTASLWTLVGISVVLLPSVLALSPRRLRPAPAPLSGGGAIAR